MKKNLSKKKMFNIAMATTLASGAVVATAPANADAAVTFKDVPASNSHAKAIINLAERGIIKGFADGTFGPNKTVTRGQAAKIIAGILELDTKNVKNPNFKDVKTTDEYYGAIAAIKAEGIISGRQDGTYGQNEPLTRGQMAKIIVEGFDLQDESETPFTDVSEKNTFANYIKVLYGNKVTNGTTATTFSPNAFVTRGQLASFVVRAESLETTVGNDVTATISQVSASQIVTSKGTFKVDPSVAKVFNEANASALKNADVELIIEYTNEKVAAVGEFFAAKTGKVVGVKGLTLNTSDTSFNAGGYLIQNLVVNATKVAISDIKAETLQVNKDGVTITGATIEKAINVAKNIIVVLNEVVAPKVNLEEGSKLTLDLKSIITELNLPANVKIEDIITNYTEIKDKLKDIIKEIITGGTTTPPVTPPAGGGGGGSSTPPPTGGGSGGGSTTPPAKDSLDSTVDSVIWKAIEQFDSKYSYIDVDPYPDNNVVEFKIIDPDTTLTQVKDDMAEFDAGYSIFDIVDDSNFPGIVNAFKNLETVSVGSGTYAKEDLLDKDFTKKLILKFVSENQNGATTIGELKNQSTTVTVYFGEKYETVSYTLKIVNEKE